MMHLEPLAGVAESAAATRSEQGGLALLRPLRGLQIFDVGHRTERPHSGTLFLSASARAISNTRRAAMSSTESGRGPDALSSDSQRLVATE
jgi:hypothetical protein